MAEEQHGEKQMFGEQLLNEEMHKVGVKSDDQGNMSPQDLVRLKHSINQQIHYCGLNAKEVTEKKKIRPEEWAAARKRYAELVKTFGYRVHAVWWIVAIALMLIAYFDGASRLYAGPIFAFVMAFIVWKLGQADGYKEGFFVGYENGYEGGINKLLGIDAAESEDIYERSKEMQIDEGLIASFENNKPK